MLSYRACESDRLLMSFPGYKAVGHFILAASCLVASHCHWIYKKADCFSEKQLRRINQSKRKQANWLQNHLSEVVSPFLLQPPTSDVYLPIVLYLLSSIQCAIESHRLGFTGFFVCFLDCTQVVVPICAFGVFVTRRSPLCAIGHRREYTEVLSSS